MVWRCARAHRPAPTLALSAASALLMISVGGRAGVAAVVSRSVGERSLQETAPVIAKPVRDVSGRGDVPEESRRALLGLKR